MPAFEEHRTAAFKAIFLKTFKVMPRRLEEVLATAGWKSFVDFMADVARFGAEIQAERRVPLGQANTEGMLEMLREVFGVSEIEAVRNLRELEADSWTDMTKAVLALAVEIYAADHRGRTPLDDAKEATRKFFTMDTENPAQVLEVIKAFGFPSPRHFEAVLHSAFSGELTPEDLDLALEHPEILGELVNRSPSNPHKGIDFSGAEGAP